MEVDPSRGLMIWSAFGGTTSAVATAVLRSAVCLVPAWGGAMAFVPTVLTKEVLEPDASDFFLWLAGGFGLVALLCFGAGWVLGRPTAWTGAALIALAVGLPRLRRMARAGHVT